MQSLARHQRNWYGRWHTLAGLSAGAILLVVSLTGCLLVFEQELDVWFYPETFGFAEADRPLLSLETVYGAVTTAHPEVSFRGIYRFPLRNDAYLLYARDSLNSQYIANPHTGEVTGVRVYEESVMGFIRHLHRTLFIPKVGKYLVGCSALLGAILMITGLRLWIPKRWRHLRQRLGVKWSGSAKRVNYDLHNTLGFYFSPVITLLSLTGVMITFSQVVLLFMFLLSFEAPQDIGKVLDQQSVYRATAPLGIDAAGVIAGGILPGAEVMGVTPPADSLGAYNFSVISPNASAEGNRMIVFVDQYSGDIIGSSEDEAYRVIKAYLNWVTPIHYGTFGGWPTRILALVASLATAGLFVLGVLIWWPRYRRRT
jgi:uncharacterized iron-regulated membrane protein